MKQSTKMILGIGALLLIGAAIATASTASKVQGITGKFKANIGIPTQLSIKNGVLSMLLPVSMNNQSAFDVSVKNMYVTVQTKNGNEWQDLFTQPTAIANVSFAKYQTSKLPSIPLSMPLTSALPIGKLITGKGSSDVKIVIRFDALGFELPPLEILVDSKTYLEPVQKFVQNNVSKIPLLNKLKLFGVAGLGYESNSFHYRKIKDGKQFDKFFNKADNKEKQISASANPFHTIELMSDIVKDTLEQTVAIAQELTGKSKAESAKNVWEFLYNNIQYKRDSQTSEQLRTPVRSWADRKSGIDCDCFAIFASSILTNMGINHAIKMCSTRADRSFQHVYVTVPKNTSHTDRNSYYVVDACLHAFDEEAKNITNEYYKIMNTTMLSGLHGDEEFVTDGLGNIFKKAAKKLAPKKVIKSATNVVKKVHNAKVNQVKKTLKVAKKVNEKANPMHLLAKKIAPKAVAKMDKKADSVIAKTANFTLPVNKTAVPVTVQTAPAPVVVAPIAPVETIAPRGFMPIQPVVDVNPTVSVAPVAPVFPTTPVVPIQPSNAPVVVPARIYSNKNFGSRRKPIIFADTIPGGSMPVNQISRQVTVPLYSGSRRQVTFAGLGCARGRR